MTSYKERLREISTFIFDVDGVFTDSKVLLLPSGEQARTMSIRDGYAVKLAAKKGYRICIISGGSEEQVRWRFEKLGITDVFLGVDNKVDVLKKYMEENGLKQEEILYMGDDLPDYDVLQMAGIKTCPSNAAEEILFLADYISDKKGGNGCVRDIVQQTLKVQGKWPVNIEDLKKLKV